MNFLTNEKPKTVCIVGHGLSPVGKGLGSFVDGHDIVIRMTECSWHRHQTKYNLFVVLWGKIGIVTEQLDGRQVETILTQGECFTTMPGQKHKFIVYENGAMIEEMYVEYSEADIQRDNQGGPS